MLCDDWYQLVGDYSGTELTYASKDKLIAISALAKKFGHILSCPYVAGLFHCDLPLGLLWSGGGGGLDLRRTMEYDDAGLEDWKEEVTPDIRESATYRAPSWYVETRFPSLGLLTHGSRSRASVDSKVYFSIPDWGHGDLRHWQESRKVLATVVNISNTLVDSRNPYGQILSASLMIKGPIAQVRPFSRSDHRSPDSLSNSSWKQEIYGDKEELFAFHTFEENRLMKNGGFRANIHGLLLSSTDLITYKRVGQYKCKGPTGCRYPVEKFREAIITIV